jgi:hypothetical protein
MPCYDFGDHSVLLPFITNNKQRGVKVGLIFKTAHRIFLLWLQSPTMAQARQKTQNLNLAPKTVLSLGLQQKTNFEFDN